MAIDPDVEGLILRLQLPVTVPEEMPRTLMAPIPRQHRVMVERDFVPVPADDARPRFLVEADNPTKLATNYFTPLYQLVMIPVNERVTAVQACEDVAGLIFRDRIPEHVPEVNGEDVRVIGDLRIMSLDERLTHRFRVGEWALAERDDVPVPVVLVACDKDITHQNVLAVALTAETKEPVNRQLPVACQSKPNCRPEGLDGHQQDENLCGSPHIAWSTCCAAVSAFAPLPFMTSLMV